ncbi:BcsR/BcsP family cellulose biosynthesis protein [Paenalcaligenes hominis]|uniref:BcsR/BcsP family cellulose biosynthesis protein n=1 Tax=Paenalcaligenes hominis TaxID=643674 RepID=UPI003525F864
MSEQSKPLIQTDDGIQALAQYLHTDDFHYEDMMAQEAWQHALKQWPLLAEWHAWSQEEST